MAKDLYVDTLHGPLLDLVRRVEKLLSRQATDPRRRILVALAGVPGSGKSTVSRALISELVARGISDVEVVPMDGFHHTQAVLSSFEHPEEAFRRRGAPFTFDALRFVKLVETLVALPVTIDEPERTILAPSFDHALKDPVENGISISSQSRLVIVEGNYTLFNQSPWCDIESCYAEKWFVDAPVKTVRDRLAKRHLAAGIESSMQAAIARAEENDIPNGALIRTLLLEPDVIIEN